MGKASGVRFIVQHPVKGRIICQAMGDVASAMRMIGRQVNGGLCVAVAEYGRQVKDNEPPEYRHQKTVATRKVDNLPSCVKRHISPDMSVKPPPIPMSRYQGFQRCMNASVDKGQALPYLSYEERLKNAMLHKPPVIVLPQPPEPDRINSAHHEWMYLLAHDPEESMGLNPFKPLPMVKRWHGQYAPYEWITEEEMDRDQWQQKVVFNHARVKDVKVPEYWFEHMDRDELNKYQCEIPKHQYYPAVITTLEQRVKQAVNRILGK